MTYRYALPILLMAQAAAAGTPFVGFEIGGGDLDLGNVQVSPDFDLRQSTGDNTVVFNFNGGYEFDNGLTISGAAETSDQINFLGLSDSVEVNVYKLGVGFGGQAAQRFRVHGTLGISFWELDARESFFVNPGPEATGSINGEDIYFDFGGEYLFNDTVSLVFLYNYNNYDFGDATAVRVGVRFRFRSD